MKIIIIGCGRVGRSIAEQLHNTGIHDLVVIDKRQIALDKIEDTQNILTITGNGATYEILEEAGAKTADLIIAVTPTDELNLYICLLANKLGIKDTIARVRNPQYSKDVDAYLSDELRLSLSINPEKIAAGEIARMIKYPGVEKVDTIGQGIADLIKIKLTNDSAVINKKVSECSHLSKDKINICLVERGENAYIPNGEFVLESGDLVSFVAPNRDALKLLKRLGYGTNQGNNVVILGGGKISYYLARELREAGVSVKIIEKSTRRCEELSEALNGVMVINGDAMEEDLIYAEGVDRSSSVASLLSTDEENVLVSLFLNKVNPNAKIITELGNLKLSSIVENLPIDTTIDSKALAGKHILRYVRALRKATGSNVQALYELANGKVEALEFEVTEESKVTGTPLSELSIKNMIQVICIIRNQSLIIPQGNDTIEKDDKVFLVTKHKGLKNLDDILK